MSIQKKSTKTTSIASSAKITFKSPRPKGMGGQKTAVLALVPRKGSITFAKLKAKAEAEKLNVAKLSKWITVMAKNGRVELHA